jgi:hypothetical protein
VERGAIQLESAMWATLHIRHRSEKSKDNMIVTDFMFLKMCGCMKFGMMRETDNSHEFQGFICSLFNKAVRNTRTH